MDFDLRTLYQEIILDHGKSPRNFGLLEHATHEAEGTNPMCGDNFHIYLLVEGGHVKGAGFTGSGCAISTASASLMTESVIGKPLEEAERLFHQLHDLVTGDAEPDVDELGKLAVFAGVRQYPMRVKCATLAWHAMHAALEGEEIASTE